MTLRYYIMYNIFIEPVENTWDKLIWKINFYRKLLTYPEGFLK